MCTCFSIGAHADFLSENAHILSRIPQKSKVRNPYARIKEFVRNPRYDGLKNNNEAGMYPFRLLKFWLSLSFILIISVIYFSLDRHAAGVPAIEHGDKLMHISTYFILMSWFAQLSRRRNHSWIALGLITFGILIEFAQGWTGFRTMDPADIVANSAGVFVGWVLASTRLARLLRVFEQTILPRRA
jgi:VanZ family protein